MVIKSRGLECTVFCVILLYVLPFNRVDFENIKEIPILVLDVNEDFKNDKIKQEYLIDKVSMKYWGVCICSSAVNMMQ